LSTKDAKNKGLRPSFSHSLGHVRASTDATLASFVNKLIRHLMLFEKPLKSDKKAPFCVKYPPKKHLTLW